MSDTVNLDINLDKACSKCGEKGAAPNGLCLGCITKLVIGRKDRIETVSRELFVDLTDDEVKTYGERLAVSLRQIAEAEEAQKDAAKAAKEAIQVMTVEMHMTAHAVRERRELRMVEVDVVPSGDGKVSEIRRDTGEVTATRPMSDRERQLSLPRVGGAMAAGGE